MVDSRASRIAAVASGLFVVAVGPAEAQFKAVAEVSSGYQLRHARGSGVVPRGWFVAGGPHVTDGIAVIGEVARNHGARAVADVPGLGPAASGEDTTYMGGILWRHPARPVTVFARLLVGARRLAVDGDMTAHGVGQPGVGPAVQAGGGIDIHFTARSAVRLAGTYLRSAGDGVSGHAARLAVGSVYRFAP